MTKVTKEEFDKLVRYIKDKSGIALDDSKYYLVESRLSPLLTQLGLDNYGALYNKALGEPGGKMENLIIDAIATHETFFFRDKNPFELFRYKLLPDHIDRTKNITPPTGVKKLNIWSAACSTGQESYSLAMVIKETIPDLTSWNIRIFGTDIGDSAVAQASYATYNRLEVERGLNQSQISRHFVPEQDRYKVRDEVRYMCTFRKFNLFHPFTGLGKFDIIFCRNVAIYFTPENRKDLFNRLADQLNPEGYLIIGSTESLFGISDRFRRLEYHNSVCYQLIS